MNGFLSILQEEFQTRAMIHGLFSQKNLKITIDRKLYRIVHFYLDFFVPHQNDVATTKIMK
jgi:hypothetical protein